MKRAKTGKAGGLDGVVSDFLKHDGDILTESLCTLLNIMWDRERVPDAWRHTAITQVCKGKASFFDTDNYTPITLMSHIMKIYERILDSRIRKVVWLPQE